VKKVAPLTSVPAAFAELAKKTNELCENLKPLKAGSLIQLTESQSDILISLNLTDEQLLQKLGDAVAGARTFFATASGADVTVSTGAINNEIAAEYTATPADGDKFYIDVEVDAFDEVVAVDIAHGASVPANTTTHGYTLLASVAVAGGVATVTPFAWNYSQVQKCGDTNYLWGGFGS
jgi:hypothetical protein